MRSRALFPRMPSPTASRCLRRSRSAGRKAEGGDLADGVRLLIDAGQQAHSVASDRRWPPAGEPMHRRRTSRDP